MTVRIGKLAVGRIPRIVGTVISTDGLGRVFRLKKRPFDLLEVRADILPAEAAWREAAAKIQRTGVPVLLTLRSRREGGAWRGGEMERKKCYLANLDAVDAVDVEIRSVLLKSIARAARKRGKIVIGSFHDFTRTPRSDTLRRIVARGRAAGAHIVKIATHLRDRGDIVRLAGLLADSAGGPLAVVGMGPLAAAARVALACAGSCLTYGYVDRPAAPGQPSCRELAERLRRECPGFAADRRARRL
ncbi:MAG: type I 3-dehydroquinate dehydratase [Verrucomicrobia bacterium]|nr:type I 3-dehydroquinate dehydratase [Verrucomicrobiota bacterium]